MMDTGRIWYTHFTDTVAAKARTNEMLQELILAIVHTAADYDMFVTEKSCPDHECFRDSYDYYRDLLDKLGIPPHAITDAIDGCFPDDPRENLTERVATVGQASTN